METPRHSLINVAPLAEVTISSKSRWSTDDDEREIVTAEHDRNFSFHTDLEESPWILVDLKRDYRINHIRILNRLDTNKEKAKTLQIEYSNDKEHYSVLSDTNENGGDVLDITVENIDIRFLKFSLKERHYFHLKKIEIFTDSESIKSLLINNLSDPIAEVTSPLWINKNGKGYVIQSCAGKLSFSISCYNDGSFYIALRGPDIRDRENKRINRYILYTDGMINLEKIAKLPKEVCHDLPIIINLDYKEGDIFDISLCWQPYTNKK